MIVAAGRRAKIRPGISRRGCARAAVGDGYSAGGIAQAQRVSSSRNSRLTSPAVGNGHRAFCVAEAERVSRGGDSRLPRTALFNGRDRAGFTHHVHNILIADIQPPVRVDLHPLIGLAHRADTQPLPARTEVQETVNGRYAPCHRGGHDAICYGIDDRPAVLDAQPAIANNMNAPAVRLTGVPGVRRPGAAGALVANGQRRRRSRERGDHPACLAAGVGAIPLCCTGGVAAKFCRAGDPGRGVAGDINRGGLAGRSAP